MSLSDLLSKLPTLAEQGRCAKAKHEIPTRLEERQAKRNDDSKAEDAWRKAIWKRDKGKCRWCRRECLKTLELRPERGECHHVTPRENRATRWDARSSLLVCLACHQRLTGKVGGERFVVVAAKTFTVDGVQYPDCSGAVNFKRIDKIGELT